MWTGWLKVKPDKKFGNKTLLEPTLKLCKQLLK